jgi:glycerol kinase
MRETTALGAAIAAGFAAGVWRGFEELKEINSVGRTVFTPQKSGRESDDMFKTWTKAVQMCRGWLEDGGKEER